MSQSFEYEFLFQKTYDATVFSTAPVEQTVEFEELVKNTVETMSKILDMYGGVRTFSSFITYNDKTYKITVTNL
jgi:tRNA U38,U39,U40 pseudouridine synthase TruA